MATTGRFPSNTFSRGEWAEKSIRQRPNPLAYQVAAASAAHLDRLEEGRAAVREVLRLQPDFSLSGLTQFFAPADPDFVERMIGGLRKVGFLREKPLRRRGSQPSLRM